MFFNVTLVIPNKSFGCVSINDWTSYRIILFSVPFIYYCFPFQLGRTLQSPFKIAVKRYYVVVLVDGFRNWPWMRLPHWLVSHSIVGVLVIGIDKSLSSPLKRRGFSSFDYSGCVCAPVQGDENNLTKTKSSTLVLMTNKSLRSIHPPQNKKMILLLLRKQPVSLITAVSVCKLNCYFLIFILKFNWNFLLFLGFQDETC